MKFHKRQSGATLIVSLIMLTILTLLVVSAIRFGIINLKIAGNMQAEVEATAAAQVAVEQVFQQMVMPGANIAAIDKQTVDVNTGAANYRVNVDKPICVFSKPIVNSELNPARPADVPCFESSDADKLIDSAGALTTTLSACKDQQWDVGATVTDGSTGVNVSVLQGMAVRVAANVLCDAPTK